MDIINCLPLGQKSLLVKTVSGEFSTCKILIRVAMSLERIGAKINKSKFQDIVS